MSTVLRIFIQIFLEKFLFLHIIKCIRQLYALFYANRSEKRFHTDGKRRCGFDRAAKNKSTETKNKPENKTRKKQGAPKQQKEKRSGKIKNSAAAHKIARKGQPFSVQRIPGKTALPFRARGRTPE